MATCAESALLHALHLSRPLSRWVLPTLRGLMTLGARERIRLLTRWDLALEMMAGNAFSMRTGSALSFALAPQISVPV